MKYCKTTWRSLFNVGFTFWKPYNYFWLYTKRCKINKCISSRCRRGGYNPMIGRAIILNCQKIITEYKRQNINMELRHDNCRMQRQKVNKESRQDNCRRQKNNMESRQDNNRRQKWIQANFRIKLWITTSKFEMATWYTHRVTVIHSANLAPNMMVLRQTPHWLNHFNLDLSTSLLYFLRFGAQRRLFRFVTR